MNFLINEHSQELVDLHSITKTQIKKNIYIKNTPLNNSSKAKLNEYMNTPGVLIVDSRTN